MAFKHNLTYKLFLYVPTIFIFMLGLTGIIIGTILFCVITVKCFYDRIYIDESMVSIRYLSLQEFGFVNKSWSLRRVREIKRRTIGLGFNEVLIKGTYDTTYLMGGVKHSKRLIKYYESLL